MVKLTERQRRELRDDIKGNSFTRDQISARYGIAERQLQRYYKEQDLNRGMGRPVKEAVFMQPIKENKTEVKAEPTAEPVSEPVTEPTGDAIASEEREELKAGKLTGQAELDPNQDYCGDCHSRGIITQLEKGWARCPVCGAELNW